MAFLPAFPGAAGLCLGGGQVSAFMDVSPRHLLGFEINERLRLIELVEERPFAYFFKGEVLALSRVVGTCSVTVYRPSARTNTHDLVEAIKAASKNLQGEYIYAAQQVDQIRHGDPAGRSPGRVGGNGGLSPPTVSCFAAAG